MRLFGGKGANASVSVDNREVSFNEVHSRLRFLDLHVLHVCAYVCVCGRPPDVPVLMNGGTHSCR